jgi:acetyltransferase-like isoleucine patch superfamily enzyme
MTLGALKHKLVLLQSLVWRPWARLLGAEVAGDASIVGRPFIKIARGGRIVISAGVRLYGSTAVNPLIRGRGCTLWAILPGAELVLGRGVGCSGVCLCAAKKIEIGEGSILGADCLVVDNDFHLPGEDWTWLDRCAETAKPVVIGRGCFIGARSVILKGVTIGDGAVIGAGAVVSRDVPAGHMATGNPAVCRPLQEPWRRSSTDSNCDPA